MQLSVIICTHNPRLDYLLRTLDALKSQSLPQEQWELLLIDNASKEPLALSWDLTWHLHGRHVREEELGLTPARLRGIKEATGELLVFVDDDNVLTLEYLERAVGIARDCPMLGSWGAGTITQEFERPPATDILRYSRFLGLKDNHYDEWSNQRSLNSSMPIGAGICIRKTFAQRYAEEAGTNPLRQALGRKGTQLTACEDTDMNLSVVEQGAGYGVFPALKLLHLIPTRRCSQTYLLTLAEAHAYSHVLLDEIHGIKHACDRPSFSATLRHLYLLLRFKGMARGIYLADRRGRAKAAAYMKQRTATVKHA